MPIPQMPMPPSTTLNPPSPFPQDEMGAPLDQAEQPSPIASPDALKARIEEFMQNVRKFETDKVGFDNEMEAFRVRTITEALRLLEDLGINPADPESIARFRQKLEEQDPDQALLFTTALERIFGAGEESQLTQQAPETSQATPQIPSPMGF